MILGTPFVSSYVGPGDIVASATGWYGLRGYSGSVAAPGTTNAVQVRRLSDDTLADVVILTTGDLDMASALSFAGTDATGNGSCAGTAFTFTGGTIGDSLASASVLPGTIIVSGSSPNWTVNKSQTFSTETVTLTFGLAVRTLYDQSGGAAGDAIQTTNGSQPFLVPGFGPDGVLPGLVFLGAQNLGTFLISQAQPLTFSAVVMRNAATTSYNAIMGGLFQTQLGFKNAVNKIVLFNATTDSEVTANDDVWHSAQGVANGAASIPYADGTTGSTGSGTAGTGTANIGSGSIGGSAFMNGAINSIGVWPVAFSAGNISDMVANDQAYWGF